MQLRTVTRFLATAVLAGFTAACAAHGGTPFEPILTHYIPLSSNLELARRLMSPLAAARLPALLAKTGSKLSAQPIDLTKEKFTVYVPGTEPAKGYALMVFLPPWNAAKLPDGWDDVMDSMGMIFVSAANSGNDQSVLGRREPLALLAEYNVVRNYRVDPDRVYIAGFSGGSRVALHIALGYPDIFRGALLDAGADPIGNEHIAIPPADLFARFQESTRLLFLTGGQDLINLGMAAVSKHSLRDWCVFHIHEQVTPGVGHAVARPAALSDALRTLEMPVEQDPGLARCRSQVQDEMNAKMRQVESLITDHKIDEARSSLAAVDARYGGLAAPHSVELMSRIGSPPP